MRRKEPLETGQIYHIFNRSIAGFIIYNNDLEYGRALRTIQHYQSSKVLFRLSYLNKSSSLITRYLNRPKRPSNANQINLVDIVAYCLMPTHYHLVLRQRLDNGISTFIGNVQNSYTKYFNIKHKRRGPLWEGRFKNILVESEDQLLHLTRYVHLNPSTAGIVQHPENWPHSSYNEYVLNENSLNNTICQYQDVLEITPSIYRAFVNDQLSYQKELALIKGLILD